MTIDEIRTKYQCDKRQTGQVVVNPIQKGGFDFRAGGFKDKKIEAEIKHEIRNKNKPNDPLANGDAKKLRDTKALVLQDLRSIEAYVKKLNDVKSIRNQIERIYPRMIGYLK